MEANGNLNYRSMHIWCQNCLTICFSFSRLFVCLPFHLSSCPRLLAGEGGLGAGFTVASLSAINPRPELFVLATTRPYFQTFKAARKIPLLISSFTEKYKMRETKYHLRWRLHRNTVLLFHWTTVPDKTQDLLEQKRNWKYLWRIIRKAPKKVWFGAQSQCLSSLHLTTKIHP